MAFGKVLLKIKRFLWSHYCDYAKQGAYGKTRDNMEQFGKKIFGDRERYLSGKAQMKMFGANQYPYWRVVAVKSIRKILLDADSFYSNLEDEIYFNKSGEGETNNQIDIVNNEIKNGWMFEAISQAEQAIEDLFSLLKNSNDIAYFAKNVVNYNATEVKKYIWNFQADKLEYIMQEFKLPYCLLDEPWEDQDTFELYKESILRMQQWLQELITFHKKYYLDYCQYKHGMSVALCPFGQQHMKSEEKRNPHEGVLITFDSYTVEKRHKVSGGLPQIAMYVDPKILPYIRHLHSEGNLLHYSMHVVSIDEIVSITEKAFALLNIVWVNLLKRCEITDEDKVNKYAFPANDYKKYYIIEFPVQ